MQNEGNLNQSEKIPLHSFVGSKAKSLCSLYCCSHLRIVKYKHWPPIHTHIPAAWSAEHFIMLSLADLHMNILFKGIQIEQSQGVISCVGGPVGCCNAHIHLTGIPDIENRNFVFANWLSTLTLTLLYSQTLLVPLQLDQELHQCNYFLPMNYLPILLQLLPQNILPLVLELKGSE